ncbi:alpha/beta fold hydrolase [Leisingera sp. McT4-56]|uniref:alpha/beta fold hydrolase n=1 Tax=Leisingera sp. McT4-56 TaxID=2881255 RepID=UPI001CF8EF4B|nr:alpha/beta fold hydrolase [Leisingera sp. McT4-56]MCB4457587.1 alpha/beta fold hydrolase [Leisingera sp. McT4-56]
MTVPVLFLHGWSMNGAVFDDMAQRLGTGFTCYAPDLPGHGNRLEDDASLDSCAALVKRWIDRLDRPILVGWSMGAGVAWRYVAQHGTSGLRGLVTIDMSPRMLPGADWEHGLIGQSAEAILETSGRIVPEWPRIAGSIVRNMYARNSAPALSRESVEEFLLVQDPARLRPLWDDLATMDERQTIPLIDIPYLVCCGAQSRLYSVKTARFIASQAQQARVECFRRSGHSPHLEEPEAFCNAFRSFVAVEGLETEIEDKEAT